MNIVGYVKKFGDKTFKELPFNDIDALIFSEISYLNIDLLFTGHRFVKLKDLVIEDKKEFYYSSVDSFNNRRLFESMMKSKRYGNVKIGYGKGNVNLKTNEQFYALTIILPDKTRFISFRGTDITISGWKEDLLIAFQEGIPSQKSALKYVKEVLKKFDTNFYLGGHSKGGNLAIYSALHMGKRYEKRLIKAFSFDGPGFRSNIYNLDSYRRISNRFEKYLTTHDMIGVIYNKNPNPKIVYSDGILLGGHDLFAWNIKRNEPTFVYAKERSAFSKESEVALMNWLYSEDDDSKEIAVKMVFDILGDSKTVFDLLLNAGRLITNGKKSYDKYPPEQKEKVKEIFKQLGKYYLSAYSPKKFLLQKFKAKKEETE